MTFRLNTKFSPAGDQPRAIENIVSSLRRGDRYHVLLGVTGSGKTFTMANVIAQLNRSALIIAPNKTLAAQLYLELKEFFPNNSVGFFISYYDYYQPEAYVPSTNTYIAKDSSINDDIDKMRHDSTISLFEQKSAVVVASVSCIYGLGSPSAYSNLVVHLQVAQAIERDELLRSLIDIQYTRNDHNFTRGTFRVRGDVIDILPANHSEHGIRIIVHEDHIESLAIVDVLSGQVQETVTKISIYPNSHYVAERSDMKSIIQEILTDLGHALRQLKAQNKMLEYQRLEMRTMQDIEIMEQLGYCPGIENYSRYLTGKKPGEAPPCLLDYFPKDFITIVDESHITIPQIGAMYRGDRSRKQTLVDFGFRLPSALDNRPLNFNEFLSRNHQMVLVSATPSAYDLELGANNVSEQIIRPTGLIDPKIQIKSAKNQVDDLYSEMKKTIDGGGRVLIITLTKKMAEELAEHYQNLHLKVNYLHSELDALERMEHLRDLRKGKIDALIGINLLREGLDLPEVELVAIMDADKEGFLRSKTSLIQIVGRAARNEKSRVIFFGDHVTASMEAAIAETNRRRMIQIAYNEKHNIVPYTVVKPIYDDLRVAHGLISREVPASEPTPFEKLTSLNIKTLKQLDKLIQRKTKEMKSCAGKLEFEKASQLRDELKDLQGMRFYFSDVGDQ